MSRRLVLVSLDWLRPKDPRVSLGHASLLARLASTDVEVIPVARAVNAREFDREELLGTVLDAAGEDGDVALGAYVWNEPVVQWLLPHARQAGFRGRILLGGPQVSYAPPGVGRLYPDADALIRGYAEDALAALVATLATVHAPGVTWRGEADAITPAPVDLAALPSPILTGTLPVRSFMRWETQRGCIYRCSFCQHRESGARLRHRALADERVAAEVDALVAGGATDVAVLDPIFNTNPAAADILGRFARRGFAGRLSLQSRFELADDAFLDACAGLDVRLEFGLQTIHRAEMRAVGRINDLDAADRVVSDLHARGVPFEVSLIYGLPEQTLASFEASVRWCRDRGVPVRAFPLMLLRGTGLDRQRERWALVESDDPIPVVVSSSTFSREEWERMSEIALALDDTSARGAA